MSAFLGPVHEWMYKKITFQEAFTTRLLTLSSNTFLEQLLTEKFGAVDTLPLEKIIDQSNIHGWLNQRVQRAESRFAHAVLELLKEYDGSISPLKDAAYKLGQEHALECNVSVAEAYEAIDSLLLDGMPCDGGRTVINEDDNELTFQYDNGLHILCGEGEVGLNAFTSLREALLCGILSGSKLCLTPLSEGCYKIAREG